MTTFLRASIVFTCNFDERLEAEPLAICKFFLIFMTILLTYILKFSTKEKVPRQILNFWFLGAVGIFTEFLFNPSIEIKEKKYPCCEAHSISLLFRSSD
jgi:hypothetical protein